ncbi:50S ribosomal protein L29 [Patescibacteria group bacterium]|nr:50S ribosomal protein L29 [Patescibacteria group bacterium]
MKIKEIRQKSKQELNKLLLESHEKLRELRFKVQLKQIRKVRDMRKAKKLIAKILTILKEKQND